MAENKKSFVAYCDWVHTFRKMVIKDRLNGTNNAGELALHLFEYVNDTNPEPINEIVEFTFENFKQTLKRDLVKWVSDEPKRVEKAKKAGLASGKARELKRTKTNSQVENELKQTKSTVSVSVTDSVNVNDLKEKEIFDNLRFEIINSKKWIADTCRILKQPQLQIENYLHQFLDELFLKNDFYKTTIETQSHFINWVNIKINKNANGKQSNTEAALAFGAKYKTNIGS